jgi:putative membrane protein
MIKASNSLWITFTRRVPALVFLSWLCAYVWLMKGGRYAAYLNPKLWPFLVMAVTIALLFLISEIRRSRTRAHIRGGAEMWLQAILLGLPLLFLWVIHGESLGAHTLTKRSLSLNMGAPAAGQSTDADPAGSFSKDGAVEAVTLLELKIDRRQELIGKRVSTDGIVYRGKERLRDFLLEELPAGSFILFRFRVICCAADAVPIGVLVSGDNSDLKDNGWIRVTGQYVIREIGGDAVPCIKAEEVHEIPAPPPEQRYLFRQRSWN